MPKIDRAGRARALPPRRWIGRTAHLKARAAPRRRRGMGPSPPGTVLRARRVVLFHFFVKMSPRGRGRGLCTSFPEGHRSETFATGSKPAHLLLRRPCCKSGWRVVLSCTPASHGIYYPTTSRPPDCADAIQLYRREYASLESHWNPPGRCFSLPLIQSIPAPLWLLIRQSYRVDYGPLSLWSEYPCRHPLH